MYNHSSALIAGILFIIILIGYEIGFRLGRFNQKKTDNEVKIQTRAIQGGTLGLLALLLGFTFNMALQRFDNRSYAEINEANAIGTAMLRTNLLPAPYDSLLYDLFQDYIDLRIEIGGIDLTEIETRKEINERTDEIESEMWTMAVDASEVDPRPVTTGFFITSLNDMIDARGERMAILQRHVPEIILFLLFAIFIISSSIMGYSSGLGLKRAYIPTALLTF